MIKKTIYKSTFESPFGLIVLGGTDKGLCLLEFGNEKRINNHFAQFSKHWEYIVIEEENEILNTAKAQLDEYFNGKRKEFEIQLDLIGTNFQLEVWNELLKIPYGVTRSYKEQALAIGNLKAIRAVATANGQNKISIIIPCHRVIGSDGSLTGYGGEIWRKRELLKLESTQVELF